MGSNQAWVALSLAGCDRERALPEARLLELLNIELNVFLGHDPADAWLLRDLHEEAA